MLAQEWIGSGRKFSWPCHTFYQSLYFAIGGIIIEMYLDPKIIILDKVWKSQDRIFIALHPCWEDAPSLFVLVTIATRTESHSKRKIFQWEHLFQWQLSTCDYKKKRSQAILHAQPASRLSRDSFH